MSFSLISRLSRTLSFPTAKNSNSLPLPNITLSKFVGWRFIRAFLLWVMFREHPLLKYHFSSSVFTGLVTRRLSTAAFRFQIFFVMGYTLPSDPFCRVYIVFACVLIPSIWWVFSLFLECMRGGLAFPTEVRTSLRWKFSLFVWLILNGYNLYLVYPWMFFPIGRRLSIVLEPESLSSNFFLSCTSSFWAS